MWKLNKSFSKFFSINKDKEKKDNKFQKKIEKLDKEIEDFEKEFQIAKKGKRYRII